MLPPVLSDRGTKRTAAPPPPARKFRSMVEVMRDSKQVDPVTSEGYSEVRCEQCRLGDSESELVLCDGCDKGFHIYCLRPIVVRVPTGSWFCPGCQDSKPLKSKRW